MKNGLQTHLKAISYLSSCKQHDSVSSQTKNFITYTKVSIWEHRALDHYIFVHGKIEYLASLSLLVTCKILFKTVDWKISSLTNGSFFRRYKSPALWNS